MATLVMDTATEVLAVAAGDDTGLLASSSSRVARGHSRLLQPALQHVLRQSGIQIQNVNTIGVGVGPGSYTGVRLGVSTAKAMASVTGAAVVAVSTLKMMAEAAAPEFCSQAFAVMPLLYARRQRAFGALYEKQGRAWRTVVPDQVLPISEWMNHLSAHLQHSESGVSAHAVHDFAERYGVLDLLESASFTGYTHIQTVAGGLGASLFRLANSLQGQVYEGDSLHLLAPEYGLQVEAEVKLAERSRV